MAEASIYTIRIRGILKENGIRRFEGFTITGYPKGDTLLTGSVIDQAALHGIIRQVQALGMTLISVHEVNKEGE